MMYVRIRKQENREYLVLTTKDKKRVKINLNRLKYKPIHAIQLIYSLSAGQILQLGGSVSIMKNLDGTFAISDYAKYIAREKEFKKSVKGGDEFRVAKTWCFGDGDFYYSMENLSVGEKVKIKILNGQVYCLTENSGLVKIPYFVLEKTVNPIEDFDYSKIILDPSKLVKGKKYYAGDSVLSLLKKIGNNETRIFGKAETLDVGYLASPRVSERIQLGFTDSGFWYSLWYPVEEKYKPYAKPDLAWLGKNVKAKASGETTMISKITYSTRGEFVNLSNGIMFELGMMFEHYTWEDGTPFGDVEDEKR